MSTIDKEYFKKAFPRTRRIRTKREKLNSQFERYLKDFSYFNAGLIDIIRNWEFVNEDVKEEFYTSLKAFSATIAKYAPVVEA